MTISVRGVKWVKWMEDVDDDAMQCAEVSRLIAVCCGEKCLAEDLPASTHSGRRYGKAVAFYHNIKEH